MKKSTKLYNVIFPVWLIGIAVPWVWLVVIPGNFLIDSLVLLAGMYALKISAKKEFYKTHILKIYLFGMLSDFIGSLFMFVAMFLLDVGRMGDELYLTIPGVLLSAGMIFIFNYFITFKKIEYKERLKLSIIFAVVTAPYTFLIPTSWIY